MGSWQQCQQLGKSAVLAVAAEQRRRRQWQRGAGSSGCGQLGDGGSSLAEARLWRQRPTTMMTPHDNDNGGSAGGDDVGGMVFLTDKAFSNHGGGERGE